MAQRIGIIFLSVCAALAAATPAHAQKVDPRLCDALVKATPDPNVAYQPGVDVHGNAVAPADLPGSPQIQMPKVINIPLTINMAQAAHLDTSSYPFNQLGAGTEATLGTISIEDNRVTFNGQPISDADQDRLAVLCMKPN